MIQHELVGKFWGVSYDGSKFSISRFFPYHQKLKELYDLRDKYSRLYPKFGAQNNGFFLLQFFEIKMEKLDLDDRTKISAIRKAYGKDFPNIPILYSKLNSFFSAVNDYFIEKAKMSPNYVT